MQMALKNPTVCEGPRSKGGMITDLYSFTVMNMMSVMVILTTSRDFQFQPNRACNNNIRLMSITVK